MPALPLAYTSDACDAGPDQLHALSWLVAAGDEICSELSKDCQLLSCRSSDQLFCSVRAYCGPNCTASMPLRSVPL